MSDDLDAALDCVRTYWPNANVRIGVDWQNHGLFFAALGYCPQSASGHGPTRLAAVNDLLKNIETGYRDA